MIDSAMLARLIKQTGGDVSINLARAIWNTAQAEEREECAKICENKSDGFADHGYELATEHCAKAIRNRKT